MNRLESELMQFDVQLVDCLLRDLFPICRSLTGNGNRKTLERLANEVPLRIQEIPSGTKCFDWEVPPEWNVRDAWIKDFSGRKIVDFQESNIHLVNYSIPVRESLSFSELCKHIHTLPEMPDAWPYRHSYYKRDWGFCMSHSDFESMDRNGQYEVYVDSDLNADGSLTIADCRHEGESGLEYFISTYCCHPSLANDNLSGLVLSVLLFKRLLSVETYHSYRLIIAPETIGVISYLHRYQEEMRQSSGGFVVTTVAGQGPLGYKQSFIGKHEVDLAANLALRGREYKTYVFHPDGSDERQYSSPEFRIPTGSITKDKYYEYPEYHTSMDDLNFVKAENLLATLEVYWEAIMNLERNRVLQRVDGHCEIQLGKYGLYPSIGGAVYQPAVNTESNKLQPEQSIDEQIDAMSWLMHSLDGKTGLMEVADRSGTDMNLLYNCAERMVSAGLLKQVKQN